VTMTGGINHAMNIPVDLLSCNKMDNEGKCIIRVQQSELSCVYLFFVCL